MHDIRVRAKESLIISAQHDLASWKEVNIWAKIIFAVKLRNPYFHHIRQIGRQNTSPPPKKAHIGLAQVL